MYVGANKSCFRGIILLKAIILLSFTNWEIQQNRVTKKKYNGYISVQLFTLG